jgi:hypothetical protein
MTYTLLLISISERKINVHWITITCVIFSVLFMAGTFIVAFAYFIEADSIKSKFMAFIWAAFSSAIGLMCGLAIGAADLTEESANVVSAAWCACSLILLISSIWEPPPYYSTSPNKDYSADVRIEYVKTSTPKARSQAASDIDTLNFKTSGHIPLLKTDNSSTLRARGMTKLYSNWRQVYFDMGSPYGQAVMAEVYLVPEKDNAFDSHAIAVAFGEIKLGYVPASHAPQLERLITQAGGVVRAEAELWFDFRTREKRNSIRLLVRVPFALDS